MLDWLFQKRKTEWERRLESAAPNDPEFQDRQVSLDDPEIPEPIRELVKKDYEPGDQLWRMVCRTGIEWWLLDKEGDFKDAWWMK